MGGAEKCLEAGLLRPHQERRGTEKSEGQVFMIHILRKAHFMGFADLPRLF
jgi:hypothetical protein